MIEINLLKQLQAESKKVSHTSKVVTSICFLIILSLVAICATIYFSSQYLAKIKENKETELAALEKKEEKLTEIKKIISEAEKINSQVKGLKEKKIVWSEILEEIARLTPPNVTINKISPKSGSGKSVSGFGSELKIEGESKTRRDLAVFIDSLEKSEKFEAVTLIKSQKSSGEKNNTNPSFEIKLKIK